MAMKIKRPVNRSSGTRSARLATAALFLMWALSTASAAGDTFTWAHPLPAGNPLNAVAFVDHLRGWAVGHNGVVLRTSDGGNSWSLVPNTWQTLPDLHDVVALDSLTVVAVGAGAGAYRSTDGGLTWSAVPAPHLGRLVNLTQVGTRLVAVGDDGAVAASPDQGLTWTALPSPGVGYLSDQHWFDQNHGIVTAGAFPFFDGYASRTRDGGLTWETLAGVAPWTLHNIDFVDANTGFMIGEFNAYRSDDGGETWQDIHFSFPPYSHRMVSLPGDVWLVASFGEGAEIHRSVDHGATWSRAFDNLPHLGVSDLIPLPGGRLVAVLPSGAVITSDDEGLTWQGRLTDLTDLGGQSLYQIELGTDGRGWAASNYSEYADSLAWFQTEDGGRTWQAGNPPPGWFSFFDMVLRDDQTGFLAGYYPGPPYQIARTLDAGQTWENLPVPGGVSAARLDSPIAGVVYALFRDSSGLTKVWRSDDDGDLWQVAANGLPATIPLSDLDFVNAEVGFAAGGGENSVFYRTTNGGQSWQARSAGGLGWYPRQVEFQSPTTGLASCQDGIYRTTDGGASWQKQLEGFSWWGLELDAQGRGAALGNTEGSLLLTEDGGATWRSLAVPWNGWDGRHQTDIPWYSLARSGQDLVVAGSYAVILHLEIDGLTPTPPPDARPLMGVAAVPNPFNPATELRFELSRPGATRVELYDLRGHRVRQLVAGNLASGWHTVRWDGRDDAGQALPSGTYLARVSNGSQQATAKLVLVR